MGKSGDSGGIVGIVGREWEKSGDSGVESGG